MPAKPAPALNTPFYTLDAGSPSAAHTKQHHRFPWAAELLAQRVLRWGGYPGRRWAGAMRRQQGRARGGQPFVVRTHDGLQLACWFSPAAANVPRRLPIILSHGWIEIKERHFDRAWQLNAAGHDVILFDHRAHGQSQGRWSSFGVYERQDLAAVIAVARAGNWIPSDARVITMGYSMGAATVLQHAPNDPEVAGVVAMAPFATLREAVRSFRFKFAPWMSDGWLLAGFDRASGRRGFAMRQSSTLDAFAHITVPVLLIEAACDRNLPPAFHTQPLAAAGTRGRLELLSIPKASHVSLCRRTWPGLDEAVLRFCAALTTEAQRHGENGE